LEDKVTGLDWIGGYGHRIGLDSPCLGEEKIVEISSA